MLRGKKILIGITGGIAAYKIPLLVRILIKQGAAVKVIMTPEACDFVTPLTLSVLSQNPVAIEPFDKQSGSWNSHIDLGLWADAFVIAPLTVNTMAKMATGITDNLLTAVYLASRCPVFFAPSMDVDMFNHPTTQANIKKLQSFGNILIEPSSGELASGLTGMGRLEEPENIVTILGNFFAKTQSLFGKNVLISSGPTIESIDPVRFISNHSTGKMGRALALEAAARGAHVVMVSGPVADYTDHPSIDVVKVTSAASMFEACTSRAAEADIIIMAAAVADYTPAEPATTKIKKSESEITLKLNRTRDILAEIGKHKKPGQFLVGFALETNDELQNANKKLQEKNLDCVVLNSLRDSGAGFGGDTNKVTIVTHNKTDVFELKSKKEVAADIFNFIGF